MDPFAVIIFGGLAGILVAVMLLGKYYPGNGADVLDWKPTRSPEVEALNEIDDIDQMLEAANRRRRARGQAELSEDSLRLAVAEDVRAGHARAAAYAADRAADAAAKGEVGESDEEIAQLLEVKNRRRARKGLPALSPEDYKRGLEQGG